MSEGVALPTITGLAVGISFVIIVVLFMNNIHRMMEGGDHASIVIIPEGASLEDSGKTYEPRIVKTILGVNNTVIWINEDSVPNWIEADNDNDPIFYKVTSNPTLLFDDSSTIQYTFTKVGEYGFHGKPHQRGTVIVLPSYCQIAFLC